MFHKKIDEDLKRQIGEVHQWHGEMLDKIAETNFGSNLFPFELVSKIKHLLKPRNFHR